LREYKSKMLNILKKRGGNISFGAQDRYQAFILNCCFLSFLKSFNSMAGKFYPYSVCKLLQNLVFFDFEGDRVVYSSKFPSLSSSSLETGELYFLPHPKGLNKELTSALSLGLLRRVFFFLF